MGRRPNRRDVSPARRGLIFGGLAFVLALFVTFPSRQATEHLSITGALIGLFIVVALGVVFDMIGVAAAAGREEPFNAMASRRVPGARHALQLVRNADRVAAVCADMVGDVAGTVAGGAAAAVVLRLMMFTPDLETPRIVIDTLMFGAVAGLTVGGKAACKIFALRAPTQLLLAVGRVLWWMETYLHLRFFADLRRRQHR